MNTVATHDGPFHADELFAIAILKLLHPDIQVIRTRDPQRIAAADMRVDVGMKYDPLTNDYDHHQQEGAGARKNEIPFAAAGLIWKHFGMHIVTSVEAFDRLDNKLIAPLDAADNGIALYENVKLYPYTINEVVRSYAPDWQDDDQDFDHAFAKALEFAGFILEREIKKAEGTSKAKNVVLDAIEASGGKEYIVLETFCPWKKTVIEFSQAKYVLYPSHSGGWNVHGVPSEEERYDVRKPLPQAWAGLEREELRAASGVPDALFCHRGRFICGAQSKEGAIALVEKALLS